MDFPTVEINRLDFAPLGSANYGLQVSCQNTAHAKGDWQKLATVPFDSKMAMLFFGDCHNKRFLVDIGTGPSGSIATVIPNLLVAAATSNHIASHAMVPVSATNSEEVWARAQGHTTGSASCRIGVGFFDGGFGEPPMGRAETYGVSVDSTMGTLIDPGAIASTEGAWSEVASQTTISGRWMLLTVNNNQNTADANENYFLTIGMGPAGSEILLMRDIFLQGSTADNKYPATIALRASIPSSVRLAARARSGGTNATDRIFEIGVTVIE